MEGSAIRLSESQIINQINVHKYETGETSISISDIGGVPYLMWFIIEPHNPNVIKLTWLNVLTGIDHARCYLLIVLRHLLRNNYIHNKCTLVVENPQVTIQIKDNANNKKLKTVNFEEFGFNSHGLFGFRSGVKRSLIGIIVNSLELKCRQSYKNSVNNPLHKFL